MKMLKYISIPVFFAALTFMLMVEGMLLLSLLEKLVGFVSVPSGSYETALPYYAIALMLSLFLSIFYWQEIYEIKWLAHQSLSLFLASAIALAVNSYVSLESFQDYLPLVIFGVLYCFFQLRKKRFNVKNLEVTSIAAFVSGLSYVLYELSLKDLIKNLLNN